jgi:hypothetical protein
MPIHNRLLKYLRVMASRGKSEDQFVKLGADYLKEAMKPDPRDTGC